MHELILNDEHYERVLNQLAAKAKRFLWIATADIKDVHVEGPGRRFVPFLSVLADLVADGVDIRLIHAKEPGPIFQRDFDRFPEPLLILREMWRVLRGKGHVYLLEPDRASFGGLYALWDYCLRLTEPEHLRYYSASELLRLIERAGFVGGAEVARHEKLLSGGKLFATAVIVRAQRGDEESPGPTLTGEVGCG